MWRDKNVFGYTFIDRMSSDKFINCIENRFCNGNDFRTIGITLYYSMQHNVIVVKRDDFIKN